MRRKPHRLLFVVCWFQLLGWRFACLRAVPAPLLSKVQHGAFGIQEVLKMAASPLFQMPNAKWASHTSGPEKKWVLFSRFSGCGGRETLAKGSSKDLAQTRRHHEKPVNLWLSSPVFDSGNFRTSHTEHDSY